ncbi:uncharacterized protein UV8b_04809 [Ustilaginoidea virens]|uniref:Uncharacterized protein n=1 Tax=Ustilaginoidea virens TaxID=1159556 RepID=A0A8E5MHI7_USTVR|nr:uncharacterized protein UV8b_04809 [Ustilaginoidea virens]QUC20568.1 hypothetical protein UV8b_04809 [Ustilaginoidea virens]
MLLIAARRQSFKRLAKTTLPEELRPRNQRKRRRRVQPARLPGQQERGQKRPIPPSRAPGTKTGSATSRRRPSSCGLLWCPLYFVLWQLLGCLGLMILAGNTAYPTLLRLIVGTGLALLKALLDRPFAARWRLAPGPGRSFTCATF